MVKLFALVVSAALSASALDSQRPFPIGENADATNIDHQTVSPASGNEQHLPDLAIGVHFTTSYAAASVRFKNDTRKDLVRIQGDERYMELMSRWVDRNNSIECHSDYPAPYTDARSGKLCPADSKVSEITPDMTTLTSFMNNVRKAIETSLGHSITGIAPATPFFSAQHRADFRKALSLAGLTSTKSPGPGLSSVAHNEVAAAYAGLGRGLCSNWAFSADCEAEEKSMDLPNAIVLSFDDEALSHGFLAVKSAFEDENVVGYGAYSDVRRSQLPVEEGAKRAFWDNVKETIKTSSMLSLTTPSELVLMGEHGADEDFKQVVKQAFLEKEAKFDVDSDVKKYKKEDVGWLAARGAAEMGWRNEYWRMKYESCGPEHEWSKCDEREKAGLSS